MSDSPDAPKMLAVVECPSRACLRQFKVEDFMDDLPSHADLQGRPCLYVGPGRPLTGPLPS